MFWKKENNSPTFHSYILKQCLRASESSRAEKKCRIAKIVLNNQWNQPKFLPIHVFAAEIFPNKLVYVVVFNSLIVARNISQTEVPRHE